MEKQEIKIEEIRYVVFNPTGNITMLVETEVPREDQAEVALKLMEKEKAVEQVGFISYDDNGDITLRMAGGEFCGNATMSTAVYFAEKKNLKSADVKVYILDDKKIIDVNAKKNEDDSWQGKEKMPEVQSISKIDIEEYKSLPVIKYDSISHIIFPTIDIEVNKKRMENLIKDYCKRLDAKALGFMFYEKESSRLTPLVYVNNANTLFWENSCATGTAAIGAFLANEGKRQVEISIMQPAGRLSVLANPNGMVYLIGEVKFVS